MKMSDGGDKISYIHAYVRIGIGMKLYFCPEALCALLKFFKRLFLRLSTRNSRMMTEEKKFKWNLKYMYIHTFEKRVYLSEEDVIGEVPRTYC